MLAQNFKSAADLNISEPQFEALRKTLVLFETEQLIHTTDYKVKDLNSREFTGHFNMRAWSVESECGTVRCIGGTASAVSGNHYLFRNWERHDGLNALFAPNKREFPWSRITPEQAATALRSYLTTGDPRWDLAVA